MTVLRQTFKNVSILHKPRTQQDLDTTDVHTYSVITLQKPDSKKIFFFFLKTGNTFNVRVILTKSRTTVPLEINVVIRE